MDLINRTRQICSWVILTALWVYILSSYTMAADKDMCVPYKDMWYNQVIILGQPPLAVLVATPGLPLQLFKNRRGEWTLVGLADNGETACTLLTGDSFQFIGTRKA